MTQANRIFSGSEASSGERANSPVNRVDQLLVLRGVASLLVFFGHITPSNADGTIPALVVIFGTNLTWLFKPNGLVCVWIFFCLSGYLIGKGFYTHRYSLDRQGITRFYENRIKRIVPLIYFVILTTIALRNPQIFRPDHLDLLFRLITFTYSSILEGKAHPDAFVNYPLWSISVEMQFYLLAPLLYLLLFFLQKKFFSDTKINLLLIFTLVIGFLLKSLLWLMVRNEGILPVQELMYTQLFSNLDIFILGMLMNPFVIVLRRKLEKWKKVKLRIKSLPMILSWLIIFLWVIYATYHVSKIENYFVNGVTTSFSFVASSTITGLVTAIFILINECQNYDIKRSHLSRRILFRNPLRSLEYLGILSFGIYVWHMPVVASGVMNVVTTSSPSLNYFMNIGLCLLLTVLLSITTYYFIERPFLLQKKYRSLASKHDDSYQTKESEG
jgi:peptidoglycan/LPS O-acetylase OafA/YrhL